LAETQSSGGRIDYSDNGQGEPALLLMPGWCATRKAFGAMAELSAKRRRVLALNWRGHGNSAVADTDFGEAALVEDALAVIEASKARSVIPVALAHSGWVALELRRRLGARIAKIVLVDWLVLDPPAPLLAALQGLQSPACAGETRSAGTYNSYLRAALRPRVLASAAIVRSRTSLVHRNPRKCH
jgi:pimeloyl-ACP methyl ester carboxylesterase